MRTFVTVITTVGLFACGGGSSGTSTQEPTSETTGGDIRETGQPCGKNVCAVGMECCNASCGMCVSPGSMCTQQVCEGGGASTDPTPPETGAEQGSSLSCDNVRCMEGTHCEMVQVQCIRTPCDPVPQCRPDA